MNLQIRYAYFSHIGKLRKINQDNYLCLGKYHSLHAPSLRVPVTGTVRCSAFLTVWEAKSRARLPHSSPQKRPQNFCAESHAVKK